MKNSFSFFIFLRMSLLGFRSFVSTADHKKRIVRMRKRQKKQRQGQSLNEYHLENVTRKTISADRRKSMSWGNFITVDGSVAIKIGIMDTSKGSLEPVIESKLPVKVGKDMTADEDRVLVTCFGHMFSHMTQI